MDFDTWYEWYSRNNSGDVFNRTMVAHMRAAYSAGQMQPLPKKERLNNIIGRYVGENGISRAVQSRLVQQITPLLEDD